jgi:hypothetical protein
MVFVGKVFVSGTEVLIHVSKIGDRRFGSVWYAYDVV